MSTLIIPYRCKYCNRAYKLKPNYDKHYLLCDILSKTSISKTSISKTSLSKTTKVNNADDYVPSLRDMFTIILELTAKNSQLEQKVEELSKWAESKKKKLNVIDWLNEKYTKNIKYSEWLAGIIITRTHLEAVFNSDMATGCYEIIQNLLSLRIIEENTPIKAFDQKENILFIYTDDNKWEMMSQPMFANLMNILAKKLLTEFIQWQNENKNKMSQDDFSYKYARNVQKIMGGNLTQEQLHMRVKKELYNYLKMNLRNVVEYEFSF